MQDGRQRLTVRLVTGADDADGLLGLLAELDVGTVVRRDPTLEDAYVQIVTAAAAARAEG